MPLLSPSDRQFLQTGADTLIGSSLSAVSVGRAQISLIFSNGSSIDVQCPFDVYDDQLVATDHGHGLRPETSIILFRFLNSDVSEAQVDENGQTTLEFGAGGGIRIRSDETGYESYVLNASGEVYVFY